MSSLQRSLTVEHEAGTRTAKLAGELDLAVYDYALESLSWATEGTGDVVFDLSGLTFMDSTGIRLFVKIRQEMASEDRLILRSPRDNVRKALEAVGAPQLGLMLE